MYSAQNRTGRRPPEGTEWLPSQSVRRAVVFGDKTQSQEASARMVVPRQRRARDKDKAGSGFVTGSLSVEQEAAVAHI